MISKWYPSPDMVAQIAHFLFGVSIVMFPMALWQSPWAALYGTGVGAFAFIVKEFTFDLWIEGDSVDTGWKDSIYLACGVGLSWVSLLAAGRV